MEILQFFQNAADRAFAGFDRLAETELHARAVEVLAWLAHLEVDVAREVVLEEAQAELERH